MSKANGSRITPTSFWLDEPAKDQLAILVADLGMNRSAIVREAIRRMASDAAGTEAPQMAEVRRLVGELDRVITPST